MLNLHFLDVSYRRTSSLKESFRSLVAFVDCDQDYYQEILDITNSNYDAFTIIISWVVYYLNIITFRSVEVFSAILGSAYKPLDCSFFL